jgi:hypothetical protein
MWRLVYCKKIKVYIWLVINRKINKITDLYLKNVIRKSVKNNEKVYQLLNKKLLFISKYYPFIVSDKPSIFISVYCLYKSC